MILKVSVAASVVISLLVAFLVVRTSDEVAPAGTTMVVTVWDAGADLTRADARGVVAATARDHELTLYKSVNSVVDGATTRTLYEINHGEDRSLAPPSVEYRDFGRSIRTVFAPGRELSDAELVGMYVTGAGEVAADRFAEALNARGMTVTTATYGPLGAVLWTSELVPLVPLALAALLSLFLGCVHSAVDSRRQDALLRVSGASRMRTVLEHLTTGLLITLVTGAAGLLLSAPVLMAYNGLAQFPRFARAGSVGIAIVAIVVTAFVLLISVVESRVHPIDALNGQRPLRRQAVLGIAVHTGALTLVLVVVSSVVSAAGNAVANRGDANVWRAAHDFVSITFHTTNPEFESFQDDFGEIGREAERSGHALLAAHPVDPDPAAGGGPVDGNSLIVNTRFLQEQRIVDRNGNRVSVGGLDPRALTLLVPANLVAGRNDLVDQYRDWVDLQMNQNGDDNALAATTPIDVIMTAEGQRVFNYSVRDPTSAQLNPVVAVLPTAAPLVPTSWLAACMTSGELLFDDPVSLRTKLRAAGLNSTVASLDHVDDLAAVRLSDHDRVLRATTFAGVLAALVAALSAVVLALVISERTRRIDFIRHVNGAGSLVGSLPRVATVFFSALGALALSSFARTTAGSAGFGFAVIVVLLDIVIVGLLLFLQRRRLRADTLKRS